MRPPTRTLLNRGRRYPSPFVHVGANGNTIDGARDTGTDSWLSDTVGPEAEDDLGCQQPTAKASHEASQGATVGLVGEAP